MRPTRPLLSALLLAGLGAPGAGAFGLSQIQMPLPQGINSMSAASRMRVACWNARG